MKALNRLIVAAMPLVPRPIVRRVAHRYVAGETLECSGDGDRPGFRVTASRMAG
jgi:hypothetical protein